MKVVKIETKRTGYSVEQVVKRTMTVGELIDFLSDYNEDMPIVFSNDNGYTFGEITDDCFTDED